MTGDETRGPAGGDLLRRQWDAVLQRLPGGLDHHIDLVPDVALATLAPSRRTLLRRAVASVRVDLEAEPLDRCTTVADLQGYLGSPRLDDPLPLERALRCELRPILPSDYGWLYRSLVQGDRGRALFGGRTPRPEEFPAVVWANTTVVFVVEEPGGGTAHGIVTASNDHPESGFCTARAIRSTQPTAGTEGLMLDGTVLLLDHLFRSSPLRKVYLNVSSRYAPSLEWLADAELLAREGCLRDHLWFDGRHWDEHRYALWRDAWERWRSTWSRPADLHLPDALAPVPQPER